jgi:hypothetical protein
MRQDLSEKAFNQTDLTVPPNIINDHPLSVPMAEPLILLNQDRSHIVIRLHRKYFNHGSHINLFNPEWPSLAVYPEYTSFKRHVPQNPPALINHNKPIHPGSSF